MTSTRGRSAGNAPRLRFAGLARGGSAAPSVRCWRVRRWKHRVQPGLLLGHGLLKVFLPLLQRRVVELFRAAAKPIAAQAGELQL